MADVMGQRIDKDAQEFAKEYTRIYDIARALETETRDSDLEWKATLAKYTDLTGIMWLPPDLQTKTAKRVAQKTSTLNANFKSQVEAVKRAAEKSAMLNSNFMWISMARAQVEGAKKAAQDIADDYNRMIETGEYLEKPAYDARYQNVSQKAQELAVQYTRRVYGIERPAKAQVGVDYGIVDDNSITDPITNKLNVKFSMEIAHARKVHQEALDRQFAHASKSAKLGHISTRAPETEATEQDAHKDVMINQVHLIPPVMSPEQLAAVRAHQEAQELAAQRMVHDTCEVACEARAADRAARKMTVEYNRMYGLTQTPAVDTTDVHKLNMKFTRVSATEARVEVADQPTRAVEAQGEAADQELHDVDWIKLDKAVQELIDKQAAQELINKQAVQEHIRAYQAAKKTTDEQADQAAQEPTDEQADQEPTDKQADQAAQEPTDEQADQAAQEPTDEQADQAAQEPTDEQAAQEPTDEQAAQEPTDDYIYVYSFKLQPDHHQQAAQAISDQCVSATEAQVEAAREPDVAAKSRVKVAKQATQEPTNDYVDVPWGTYPRGVVQPKTPDQAGVALDQHDIKRVDTDEQTPEQAGVALDQQDIKQVDAAKQGVDAPWGTYTRAALAKIKDPGQQYINQGYWNYTRFEPKVPKQADAAAEQAAESKIPDQSVEPKAVELKVLEQDDAKQDVARMKAQLVSMTDVITRDLVQVYVNNPDDLASLRMAVDEVLNWTFVNQKHSVWNSLFAAASQADLSVRLSAQMLIRNTMAMCIARMPRMAADATAHGLLLPAAMSMDVTATIAE